MSAVVALVMLVTTMWPADARPGFLVIAVGNVLSLLMLTVLFRRTLGGRSLRRAAIVLLALAWSPALAGGQTSRFFVAGDGELTLAHAHFNERLHLRYRDAAGQYDPEALARIAHFFRSRDDGQVGEVSLRLVEMIDYVQDRYRPRTTTLISGYRSPAFNQRLRAGGAQAADSSLHIEGIAADLQFEGVDLKKLWVALREQKMAGVGYYAKESFLHIDTGRPRFWEPQTSGVGKGLSAGNARVFARTDFDRYRDLTGAVLRLHSVTAFPLRIARGARVGTTILMLAPVGEHAQIEDQCIVFSAPGHPHKLRVTEVDGPPILKQRASIELVTCDPRIEATPRTIESNLVELTP
jgi:uncharacterized protein YcbK (DUF882 family)